MWITIYQSHIMSKRRYGCLLAMEPADEDRDQAFVDAAWAIRCALVGEVILYNLQDLFDLVEAAQERTEKILCVAAFLQALAVSDLHVEKERHDTILRRVKELEGIAEAYVADQDAHRTNALHGLLASIQAIRGRLE